ncbi:hypothetical protein RhiirA5_494072 [Rhizophagus irregularis]|uniref:Uncharacterized protein n=2 Tax=Rhizophagus irregularis TaxID=588596 RepID=A0A2I1E036_9GLOM|nr:hypothetical protein RhiirA5_494072 [Rhizophagus irregularis]PKC74352.1 hypothetical protein RhiirA1_529673 [Rhizophagus irregularis]PKY15489.1 hypothetical protein RhiirB3_466743 [Rhizophagus irregularis]
MLKMSAKKSQNNTSIITSNITSLKINSNESKYLNNEVDDKVQKIQESSKQQGDDDEDLSDLANGGWEDDFTDNEDDVESRKEWETLEFLCNISKTSKNDPYKDEEEDDDDDEDEDEDEDDEDDEDDDVKNGTDSKSGSSIIDSNSEKDDDDYNDDCDDGSNGSAVERNGLEKNIKDSENNKNNKIKDVQTFSDEIDPFAKNIKQLLPIPQSNIENRKKRLSENDNEIGVGIPSQKTKKPKDDKLGNKKSP